MIQPTTAFTHPNTLDLLYASTMGTRVKEGGEKRDLITLVFVMKPRAAPVAPALNRNLIRCCVMLCGVSIGHHQGSDSIRLHEF